MFATHYRLMLVLGCSACAPTPSDWGGAKSVYVERCEGATCATGNECKGEWCLKPEAAGADYVPQLRCGDGLQQRWEPCDDGNQGNADDCVEGCRLARCGDGFLRQNRTIHDPDYEACDDGNLDETDGCLSTCRTARCGDGHLRVDLGVGDEGYEHCDDGNRSDRDDCVNCELARCGDGRVHEGIEACDDGNDQWDDGCVADCEPARCGDGHVRTDKIPGDLGYEHCDDGNQDAGDDCGNDCYPNTLPSGLGSGPEDLGHQCAQIRSAHPEAPSGVYWVDLDGMRPMPPMQIHCDMETDGGGFSRLILLQSDLMLWNAWTDGLIGQSEGQAPFGIALERLGVPATELEFYLVRDGVRVTPVFSGVPESAWNPSINDEPMQGTLSYRQPGEAPQTCPEPLAHAGDHWNWSFASASGCAAPGAAGAVILGDLEGPLVESATALQAPQEAQAVAFETLEVWLR